MSLNILIRLALLTLCFQNILYVYITSIIIYIYIINYNIYIYLSTVCLYFVNSKILLGQDYVCLAYYHMPKTESGA